MDTSDLMLRGVTPKKSPTAKEVLNRRLDIERSELAAYWALFNTSVAMLLYYDLCYLKVLKDISILLIYLEWTVCSLFTASACYDFYIHFWPHTLMRPIVVSPLDKRLLGIQEDEFGFKIAEPPQSKPEIIHDSFPPFEIQNVSDEDLKIVDAPPPRAGRLSSISTRTSSSPTSTSPK